MDKSEQPALCNLLICSLITYILGFQMLLIQQDLSTKYKETIDIQTNTHKLQSHNQAIESYITYYDPEMKGLRYCSINTIKKHTGS